jgi:hypothetical protein
VTTELADHARTNDVASLGVEIIAAGSNDNMQRAALMLSVSPHKMTSAAASWFLRASLSAAFAALAAIFAKVSIMVSTPTSPRP